MTTPNGLLINGTLHDVPGLAIIPPASHGGPLWARLDRGDATTRHAWIRQIIPHSVTGDWPQRVVPGAGSGGEGAHYADIWQSDPAHSAAHLVVDSAGVAVCLADLALVTAYHAEGSNPWSIGIEMVVAKDGTIREATLGGTARLISALCRIVGIPEQYHRGPYRDEPLLRMEVSDNGHRVNLGGPDCVGVFGHRDNTSRRGRGDPGDAIFAELAGLGFEALDYAAGEDLAKGRARQMALNLRGATLKVDGLVGPASLTEARRQGFKRWSEIPARCS